jgi:hypothetical protein
MPQPTVIQGPAYINRGTLWVYTEGDITIEYKRETWEPRGSITGGLGPRMKSTHVEVSCKPEGEVETLTGYWPYVAGDIGGSILASTALAVIPKVGNKITFPKSGVLRMPSLSLSPLTTAWDEMRFICLGDPAVEPTNVAYWQTIAAVGGGEGSADTHFDQTKVVSPRYTGAWGATPFDALEAEDGWKVEPLMETRMMYGANWGLLDVVLTTLGVRASANLINLTEAQYATLVKLQDSTALRPGDPISVVSDDRDLVISGTGLSVTLKHMGVSDAQLRYGAGTFRQGPVTFVNRRTWTAGVADALWTLA